MPYDPESHNRRSLRLQHYDYSQVGLYYVTLVTQNRACHFGKVTDDGSVSLLPAGDLVDLWWRRIPERYPTLALDEYIVMPNHLHAILTIERDGGIPLSRAIGWFKGMTTNAYLRKIKEEGWLPVEGRLWQRGFYERVIRDDRELLQVREYIQNNPWNWDEDPERPEVPA